jgi:hypothetical protein
MGICLFFEVLPIFMLIKNFFSINLIELMSSVPISLDDLFQILSFYNRPQLFKFLFVNRLFLDLLEKHFTTKPYANSILRIWTEEAEGQKITSQCTTFAGIAILDDFIGNQKMHEKITNVTKFTRKWQWYVDGSYDEVCYKNFKSK